ncbi:unnamed protein product [Mytilus coruscus]|uniref:Uncharacterized protein n=1 Tax=Mytilus coruscus TaxID=42192 RepID=A0A6J8D1S5_MYTCO|nr:unnamed protein product [Mytilus coruscus]
MRHLLPRLCIEKLYKAFVRSLLDYADVIYDNCSIADSANIEHVQRRACIISTGAIRVTKHVTLLKEVGLELLKTRRKVHRLTYLPLENSKEDKLQKEEELTLVERAVLLSAFDKLGAKPKTTSTTGLKIWLAQMAEASKQVEELKKAETT